MSYTKAHLRHETEPRAACNTNVTHYGPVKITSNLDEVTCQRCLYRAKAAILKKDLRCVDCGATDAKKYYGLTKPPVLCIKCYASAQYTPKVYQFGGEA